MHFLKKKNQIKTKIQIENKKKSTQQYLNFILEIFFKIKLKNVIKNSFNYTV